MRREHALLFGGRQPGVQRQHLDGVAWVLGDLAQRLGGVADLAFAGQEDQDVAGRLDLQFRTASTIASV